MQNLSAHNAVTFNPFVFLYQRYTALQLPTLYDSIVHGE